MIRCANFKPHICLDLWTCQLSVTINLPERRDFKSREAANFKAAVKALYTTFRGELCTN